MKKVIGMILAIIMIICLAACGSNSQSGISETTTENSQEITTEQSQTSAVNDENTEDDTESETEEETETADLNLNFSAVIEETVLVDEMGVKITATDLSYNSWQAQLSVTIENNTDKELKFYSGTAGYPRVFVNGYMVTGGYLNEEVAAGMTAEETINFSLDELTLFGMKDIAEIGIGFEIDEGYDDYLKTEPVVIKTSADSGYDYGSDIFARAMKDGVVMSLFGASLDYSSEEIVFDDSGVSVVNQYVGSNKDGDRLMFMEIKNDSDKDIVASIGDISINDVVVSSGSWDTDYVIAGKKAVMSVNISNVIEPEFLDVLGIESYGKLGYVFDVLEDDYYTEIGSSYIDIDLGGGGTSDFPGDEIYNDNQISIIYAGLLEDPYDYSDDIHALLIVKNNNDSEISIKGEDGVYIDGKKTDSRLYRQYVQPENTVLFDLKIDGDDFTKNSFEIDKISEIVLELEIKDADYKTLDEPSVTINISK